MSHLVPLKLDLHWHDPSSMHVPLFWQSAEAVHAGGISQNTPVYFERHMHALLNVSQVPYMPQLEFALGLQPVHAPSPGRHWAVDWFKWSQPTPEPTLGTSTVKNFVQFAEHGDQAPSQSSAGGWLQKPPMYPSLQTHFFVDGSRMGSSSVQDSSQCVSHEPDPDSDPDP